MKRRDLLTHSAMSLISFGLIPTRSFADGAPDILIGIPASQKKKVKYKTAPPLIDACVKRLKTLCRLIRDDMHIINNCYKKMLADIDRRLKAGGMSAEEQANLVALRKKLRSEYNRLLEISTGKSAPYIKEGRKHVFDSFCKKSGKFRKAAAKDSDAYAKAKKASTKRAKAKSARKNLKTASRIIRDALDRYTKRVNTNEKSLKKAAKAAGTKKVYTKSRRDKIRKAANRLMDRTWDLVDANSKIDGLRAFTK